MAKSDGVDSAYKPNLEARKRDFDEAREAMVDTRRMAEAARDYYDGKQLTAKHRRVMKLRKQPDVVINRTRRAIDGTIGIVEQGKTDPRAYMRNPPQQAAPAPGMGHNGGPPMQAPEPNLDAGDVASMTLRYVADRSRFQRIKLDVLEYMLIEGTAGAIVEYVDDEILISLIAADEYFWDPRSRKHDFSDKRYDGIAKWMYADDVAALYPEAKQDIENALSVGDAGLSPDSSWGDKPDENVSAWVDRRKGRLMVVDMYHREGGIWHECVFHGGGILGSGPSRYLDEKNQPMNPIEAQSVYVDRELLRYGFVRDMIDIQDEINQRRSKAIHEINVRQIQQVDPNSPPIDVNDARREAAKPDGVIPPGWQVVPRSDVVANSIEMLQEAKSELDRMAPNPAIVGRGNASASGRADQVKQQAGLVELARPLGRFTDWEHRIYSRQIWPRARQFYTDPKWIIVTDDEGAPEYVRINEPAPIDPMTGQPSGPTKNHVAKMDVDIIVDSVPDTATLEQEIWSDLVKLAETYGPQVVPFEVMVEMSPMPNKQRIIKKLKKYQAEAAQAMAQQNQIAQAQAHADVGKTQADTKLTEVKTVTEAMRGAMEARGADVMPPGVSEVANLPQNKPQPNGASRSG